MSHSTRLLRWIEISPTEIVFWHFPVGEISIHLNSLVEWLIVKLIKWNKRNSNIKGGQLQLLGYWVVVPLPAGIAHHLNGGKVVCVQQWKLTSVPDCLFRVMFSSQKTGIVDDTNDSCAAGDCLVIVHKMISGEGSCVDSQA